MRYNHVNEDVISQLIEICGKRNVLTRDFHLISYASDFYKPSPKTMPEVVVLPEKSSQISEVVKVANTNRIPLTPVGGLTGISGGAIPKFGGVVMDLRKLDKIIEIDTENMHVTCEAGITCSKLAYEVEKKGFLPPHFPASRYAATIGGSIASGGIDGRQMVQGSLGDRVSSLKVVLPDGEIIKVGGGVAGKTEKTSTGPPLKWLFVGSFGVLGVIVEATMKLYPKPEASESVLVAFNKVDNALKVAIEIKRKNIPVTCLTIWDKVAISTHKKMKYGPAIPDADALLLTDFEGPKEICTLLRQKILNICHKQNGYEINKRVIQFISGYGADFYSAIAGTGKGGWGAIDMCIPLGKVNEALNSFYRVLSKYEIEPLGALILKLNPTYIDFFYRVHDEKNRLKYTEAVKEMYSAGLKFGGSLSHGMGVKVDAKDLLITELGESLNILKKIKKVLDPYNIMNPGMLP